MKSPTLASAFVLLLALAGCGSGSEPEGKDSMESTVGQGAIKNTPPKPKGGLPKAGDGAATTPP